MVKISRAFTIDVGIYTEARNLGINMSEAAEQGIMSSLSAAKLVKEGKPMKKETEDKIRAALKELSEAQRGKLREDIANNKNWRPLWKRIIKNCTGIQITENELGEAWD